MNQKYTRKEILHYMLKRAKGIPIHIDLSNYMKIANMSLSTDLKKLSDDELKRIFHESDDIRFFAAVSEAAFRCTGLRPYIEQLAAGLLLAENQLIQMQTGEGKTLTAIFPVLMNAKKGVRTHIFTANDYLAERDAEWMGKIYSFFGYKAGFVNGTMSSIEKKKSYNSFITYVTAKQAGFDYLHDCLCTDETELLQKPFENCIVDEADFILIDEARIPLVIAREKHDIAVDPETCCAIAAELKINEDYIVDHTGRYCVLSPEGIRKVCTELNTDELTISGKIAVSGVNVALHARELLTRDLHYLVKDDSVELIDELTGRIAENREWPYGIQRALEAKEGVDIKLEGEICGSITIENFIRLYPSLSGMTATAETSAYEFFSRYDLETFIIPRHLECIRKDHPDMIFRSRAAKYNKMITIIENANSKSQPVLIGTASVLESEAVSKLLKRRGITHSVLNAAQDAKEAEIIAEAGKAAAVTVSTNMAGRGTDIILGGPDQFEHETVKEAGGLLVLSLNRQESKRIDDQLRGRAARQGDPGQSLFLLSLEDRLFERYGIKEFIPERLLRFEGDAPLTDRRPARELARAQEIINDQYAKMRGTLHNYSKITEHHRLQLLAHRSVALRANIVPVEIVEAVEAQLEGTDDSYIEISSARAAKLYVMHLDRCWLEYLETVEHIREGIHLRRLGKQEPLVEFSKEADIIFREGLEKAAADCCRLISSHGLEQAVSIVDEKRSGSTWTYIIDDNPFPSFTMGLLGMDNAVAAATGFMFSLALPVLLIEKLIKKIIVYIKKV